MGAILIMQYPGLDTEKVTWTLMFAQKRNTDLNAGYLFVNNHNEFIKTYQTAQFNPLNTELNPICQ